MKFSKALMKSILVALSVSSCVAASGQTFTPKRPLTRTTRNVENQKAPTPEDLKEAVDQPVERTIAADPSDMCPRVNAAIAGA